MPKSSAEPLLSWSVRQTGTILATLRTMNRSPGFASNNSAGSTRESEHVMTSTWGAWPAAFLSDGCPAALKHPEVGDFKEQMTGSRGPCEHRALMG